MFKRLAVLTLTLLLLASCAPEAVLPTRPVDDVPPSVAGDDAPDGELRKTLTISTMNADFYLAELQGYINAFTALHPDVTIEIHARDSSTFQATQNTSIAIAAEIMGGHGDDLILTSLISLMEYARNGMLVDLSEFLDREPGLREDFYPTTLESLSLDGGLYALPRSVVFPAYWTAESHSAQVDSLMGDQKAMRFDEAIAAFLTMPPTDNLDYVCPGFDASQIASYNLNMFFDYRTKYVNFGDVFIRSMGNIAPYFIPNSRRRPNDAQCLFTMYSASNMENASYLMRNSARRAWVVAADDGTFFAHDLGDLYGINANSKNKELAWAFLEFFTSDEGFRAVGSTLEIPARRSAMYGTFLERGGATAILPRDTTPREVADLLSALLEDENFTGYQTGLLSLLDMWMSAFDDYEDGLVTLEQLAERLQEKFTLYLNQ